MRAPNTRSSVRFVGLQRRLKEDALQLQEVSRNCRAGFKTDSPGWQPVLRRVKSAEDVVENEKCIPRRAEQAWVSRGNEQPG